MENLLREFGRLASESDLRELLIRFGLRLADARSHSDQDVIGSFAGKVDGVPVKIIHRLADDATSDSSRGRINRLSLEIPGRESIETSFYGAY